MTHIKTAGLFSAVILAAFFFGGTTFFARADDANTLPATIATTTTDTVTSTATRIVATSTCSARIISTSGTSGIMLTFSDIEGKVPSATAGHWQAASTTIAYDASQYGCGAVRAYAGASTLVTISEAR